MPKTTAEYWNPLALESGHRWKPIQGLEGSGEELTLSIHEQTGEYTRLTRFKAGADTTEFGSGSHDYPEEVFIVAGRFMTKRSRCGWSLGTMPAGPQERSTVRSEQTSVASFSNCRFQIKREVRVVVQVDAQALHTSNADRKDAAKLNHAQEGCGPAFYVPARSPKFCAHCRAHSSTQRLSKFLLAALLLACGLDWWAPP
jgi:hypothetical protein